MKKEGDGKSPAGVFAIRGAYGVRRGTARKQRSSATSRRSQATGVRRRSGLGALRQDRRPQAGRGRLGVGREMLRTDALYTWVIDVAHNPERRAARRQLHLSPRVGRSRSRRRSGCTAMEEPQLAQRCSRSSIPPTRPRFSFSCPTTTTRRSRRPGGLRASAVIFPDAVDAAARACSCRLGRRARRVRRQDAPMTMPTSRCT